MTEYKMTKKERTKLKEIADRKKALTILQESQMHIAEGIRAALEEWWLEVDKRLHIDIKTAPHTANHITGIIKEGAL